jgi:hypothetical protein
VFFVLGNDEKIGNTISTQLNTVREISPGDGYGIKALIPVAVLVFLVGIAQGVSKLLRVFGSAIPGQLVPNRTSLFLENAKHPDIVEAWRYTELGTIEDLSNEIDATIARSPVNVAKDTLFRNSRFAESIRRDCVYCQLHKRSVCNNSSYCCGDERV